MAESSSLSRPLLRRVLSFREPLMIIPYLAGFIAAAASAFFHSYASFLQSFARSLLALPAQSAPAKCASPASLYAAALSTDSETCRDGDVEEEEDVALSREEVEEIMARMGLGVSRNAAGEGAPLMATMGRGEVSRLFDADEPSFGEVRRAFSVFDGNCDGLIDASDLQGALARLGFREDADAAACGAMIAASCGGRTTMNLFQFVRFLETGLSADS